MYLIHITKEHVGGVTTDVDYWVLHPEVPTPTGTVLLADGAGGNFVCTGDRHQGPYKSNYDVCPAMVQLGVRQALMGINWLQADPAVWGG